MRDICLIFKVDILFLYIYFKCSFIRFEILFIFLNFLLLIFIYFFILKVSFSEIIFFSHPVNESKYGSESDSMKKVEQNNPN